jgi:uncharacterized membrane protein YdjX (TVP38/TMEM64 family)
MKLNFLFRGLLLIASLVLLAYVLKYTTLITLPDTEWIDAKVRGHGFGGELLFLGTGALITAIGLPRQVICFLGGYAFGFLLGGLLGLVATVAGCLAAFLYSRLFGRHLIVSRFPLRIRRLDDFIHEHPFNMTLLIRLLPVGSNLVTNLAAGVTSVRPIPFILGSAVGYIPQTLVFALIGSGIHLDPLFRIGLGVVLFILSAILGVYLYRKFRHGKSLDTEIEEQLG